MAWGYTPREIAGWLKFVERRAAFERAQRLEDINAGSRGDPKALEKKIREMTPK